MRGIASGVIAGTIKAVLGIRGTTAIAGAAIGKFRIIVNEGKIVGGATVVGIKAVTVRPAGVNTGTVRVRAGAGGGVAAILEELKRRRGGGKGR